MWSPSKEEELFDDLLKMGVPSKKGQEIETCFLWAAYILDQGLAGMDSAVFVKEELLEGRFADLELEIEDSWMQWKCPKTTSKTRYSKAREQIHADLLQKGKIIVTSMSKNVRKVILANYLEIIFHEFVSKQPNLILTIFRCFKNFLEGEE